MALSQHLGETLHSLMQLFYQLAHGVVNTSDDKIITTFIAGVCNN
jgi:hypothetical protein